jgi:hypothetical protein
MLRRLISIAGIALAALVAQAGTAGADIYTPEDPQPYTVFVSSSTVTAGTPFTILATGPDGQVFLTVSSAAAADGAVEIAGVTTEAIVVDADGTTRTVTVPAVGTYQVYVTIAAGTVISNVATITAVAPAAGGVLPVSGATSTPYLVLAGALLLAGVTALVAIRARARTRRTESTVV